MPRDTSTDTITDDLLNAYVPVLSVLGGWGVNADGSKAVYSGLALPFPVEPFPQCHIFLSGQTHDFKQGTGSRRDIDTITIRILGGPTTPGYKFNTEHATYQMITAVVNELTYRRFLEDPTNNNQPFRYIDSEGKLAVGNIGRITAFAYSGTQGQGSFSGIDIPTTVGLFINIGRLS